MHMALLRSLSILLLASMLVPGPGSAEEAPSGYRIELIHVDDDIGSSTREELISRAMVRAQLREATLSGTYGKKSVAHYREPHYIMEAIIGTAPQPFLAVVDTGSELVWTRELSHCNHNGSSSSYFTLVSCSDDMCDGPSTCYNEMCMFDKKFGTGLKAAKGFLGSARLTLSGETTDKKITLGCAIDHEDTLVPKSVDGIVGLSRGRRSLWKQMKVTNFSYCLSDQSNTELNSPLWIGLPVPDPNPNPNPNPNDANDMKSTPLVELSSDPSVAAVKYTDKHNIELSAISIGEEKKELPKEQFTFKSKKGEGAMMVDSGTWRTVLEEPVFVELKNLLAEKLNQAPNSITKHGLEFTCFKQDAEKPNNKPPLKLHFKPDAEMLIPWDYYMYLFKDESQFCLTINQTKGISTLGNSLQQNILMQYDLTEGKEKLSFKRVVDCNKYMI